MKTPNANDLDRLRAEYIDRQRRLAGNDRYSLFNIANLLTIQQRQRAVIQILNQHGFNQLADKRILELGCGQGGVLLEFLSYGAGPNCLHGTDLLPGRLRDAHAQLAHLPLTCADGQQLPYASDTFDLLLQYTVFSSILDEAIKTRLAGEMLRVLRRSGGLILWYDFWINPTNPHTRGIRPARIRRLFPGCHFDFHQITLAPPLTRRLAPVSGLLCAILENLRLFNTHYLVAIYR